MAKAVCLNGHEFDTDKLEFCPRCGAPASNGEGAPSDGFFGFGEESAEPAPFRTVFMPADSTPSAPPPPVQSMRAMPQSAPRGGSVHAGGAAHAPAQQNRPAPPPQPMQNGGQQFPPPPAYHGAPPSQSRQYPPTGQPQPAVHGKPAPAQYGAPPQPAVHGQPMRGQPMPMGQKIPSQPAPQHMPGQFMNPQQMGMPPQYMNMPQGQQGQPAPFAEPLGMGELGGIGMTAQMSPDRLMPPPIPSDSDPDGDMTIGFTPEENAPQLPVGCLIVLNGTSKGALYTLNTGRNIIGRNGKGQEFAVDLKFNKKVHRAPQAVISYDGASRRYTLIPCSGSQNAVYLGGSQEPLNSPAFINSYDRILIEGTVLMFIGYCGGAFSWETL